MNVVKPLDTKGQPIILNLGTLGIPCPTTTSIHNITTDGEKGSLHYNPTLANHPVKTVCYA